MYFYRAVTAGEDEQSCGYSTIEECRKAILQTGYHGFFEITTRSQEHPNLFPLVEIDTVQFNYWAKKWFLWTPEDGEFILKDDKLIKWDSESFLKEQGV